MISRRKALLDTTALVAAAVVTPRVIFKEESWQGEPAQVWAHDGRLIIYMANGPSNSVGVPDGPFTPRYPEPPKGTLPSRFIQG